MTVADRFNIPGPNHDDYERAIVDALKKEDIHDNVSFFGAIDRRRQKDGSFNDFYVSVGPWIGTALEPVDRSIAEPHDPSARKGHAAMWGIGFGRIFVPSAHDPSVDLSQIVPTFPSGMEKIEDNLERNAVIGHYFMAQGEEGLDAMGEGANAQLEELESKLIDDVTAQRYFRIGCGIVGYAAIQAHAMHNRLIYFSEELAILEASDDSGWDDGIWELLKNNK